MLFLELVDFFAPPAPFLELVDLELVDFLAPPELFLELVDFFLAPVEELLDEAERLRSEPSLLLLFIPPP